VQSNKYEIPHITITFLDIQTTMSASSTSFLPVSTTIGVNKEEKLVFHKTGRERLEFDEQTCKNERVKEGKIVYLFKMVMYICIRR
jgi:hypothetical protein